VVIDSIEQSFAIAGQSADRLNNLYKGNMVSYVQCQECGYESKTDSIFMDIVLPIMNEFGTGVLNSSLEMALENYLKPETLEG
jgi:ubiquitin C-terminal hydrolase